MKINIILASASKRRSAILSSCGIKHRVVPSGAKEDIRISKLPHRVAMLNARMKAEKALRGFKSGYIIGADTVVLLGNKIIGKPRNAQHAKKMLKEMSGKTISVWTGLCVINANTKKIISGYEKSKVRVKQIKETDIPRYFKLLGPYDKAGGFSIEGVGSFIFDDIKGSYFNVLGLPIAKLRELFNKLGIDILTVVC